ncbi:transcription antitermination factor NusB [Planktosalinus lacus]|uniref:N utilization substance protein B n=1 Tax=Planktosalinus lacus TaxID=1526573 RepID=A0A8J2VAN3_9FLAO|nr:transcription antitermination factor NusB [Planktosalinus lacus]GGD92274.1 N utilization substance protein B [Planktosalinus lacus]
MLTRRHIRVKVLQSLYAYKNQEQANLQKEEKFLVNSMEKMLDLYLLMLSLMLAVRDQAENFMELSKNKHLPTEEDISPSRNFIDNTVLNLLENDPSFINLVEKHKLNNWQIDNEYPQIISKELRKDTFYKEYLALKTPTLKQDKDFIIYFFKEVIAPNDKLYEYLEDSQLTWIDDFPIVNTAILKVLNSIKSETKPVKWTSGLFKNDDDKQFAGTLFKTTIQEEETLIQEIEGKTPNWDQERIAELDLIIIKMALVEFLHFPSIPVKVTINEYLEIAKEYSTPKSSLFINGLLDKISKDYSIANKINKTGRGLQ